MKAKKWLIVVLSAIMALAVAFGVAACGVDKYDHANDTFEWTDNADGTHNGKASCDDRTHDVANEAHTWGTDNKCTKCGAEKPQEQPQHKFATGWTTDANNHWHICENHPTDTADVSGKAAHADANNDGKCDTCQYQMTKPTPDPEHKFATGWTTDENNHWHICENHPTDTADVSEKGEHVDANNDGKCDTCEYDMPSDIPTPPELEEGWYVMGTVASLPTVNWNTYVKEGFVGTDLTITLTLTATDEFKFCKYVEADNADVNWNNGQIGYTAANADLFTGAGQPTGDNFKAKVEGQYTFTLNVTANTATVTKVEEECDHQWKWQSNDTQHWQVCDLCGAEKEGSRVAHDQLSEKTNTEQHWKECATCGYVSTKTNHTLTWQSTAEQHWQKCNGCDYTTDKVAHDAKELQKDETGHWYKCTTCNWEETEKTQHNWGSDNKCTECQYDQGHQHNYECKSNDEQHWLECTGCNDKKDYANHTFEEGWTSDGEATHSHKTTCTEHAAITVTEDHHLSVEANDTQHWNKCSDCTYTSTPVNHDWSYADKEDGEHHTKTSTCEGHEAKTVEEAHTWGDNDECTFCHAKKPVEADTRVFYVAGNFEGSSFEWPKEGALPKMTLDTDNGFLYTITIFMYKGEAFKIAGFDQEQTSAPENLWALEVNYADYADEQKTFTEGEFGNLVAPKTGYFLIKLYTNDTYQNDGDSFSINIEEDTSATFEWDLHVYGTMNDWGAGENKLAMTKGEGNTYTVDITITAEDLKKVDADGKAIVPALKVVNLHSGNAKWFGADSSDENPDGNYWLTEAGVYTIIFNTETLKISHTVNGKPGPQPDPEFEVSVVLTYTTDSWSTKQDLTFTEITETYEGHHFQLKYELPAGAEFYLHAKISKDADEINCNYGGLSQGNDLFDSSIGGMGAANFVVKTAATYVFDFYFDTVFDGQPQVPHFDASTDAEITPTEGKVVLVYVDSSTDWAAGKQHEVNLTEDADWAEDGKHYTTTQQLPAKAEFYLYETVSSTKAVYYNFGNIAVRHDAGLFTSSGGNTPNFIVANEGKYVFEFFLNTPGDTTHFDVKTEGGETPEPPKTQEITLHYHNKNNWAQVAYWSWDDATNYTGGTWPGKLVTETETNKWVKVTYSVSTESLNNGTIWVIFNNNNKNSQSIDIRISADKLTENNEAWISGGNNGVYTTKAAAEEADTKGYISALIGSDWSTNNWSEKPMEEETSYQGGQKFTYTVTLRAGQQVYFHLSNGEYPKTLSSGQNYFTGGSGADNLHTTAAGTYTFTLIYNSTTKTTTLSVVKENASAAVALEAMLPVYDVKSYLGA